MILALILVGVAFLLVLAEILFPSFGILSILAATAYAFALVEGFRASDGGGWTVVTLGVILLPVAITAGLRILPKTPFGRRLFLRPPPLPSRVPLDGIAPGDLGRTVTALRPQGFARFAGQRIAVVSTGDFLSPDQAVRIVSVNGNDVVVRAETDPPRAPATPPREAPDSTPEHRISSP